MCHPVFYHVISPMLLSAEVFTNMAGVIVAVSCFSLFVVTNGVTITGPSLERLVVKYGDEIALFCNYTLQSGETGTVGTTAVLSVNGSNVADRVYLYNEVGGSGQNGAPNPYFNYFLTRSGDIEGLRYPNSIGIRIQNTQWTDSGNYTWYLTIDANTAGTVTKTYEVIIGDKPGSASLVPSHVVGMAYTLICTVTGGIPSPSITILNGTEVINSSSTSPTTINVTVEFPSVFYCVGTNVLGSTNDSLALPEPTTTMLPTTSTVTTTGDNTASTTTKPPDKNQTEDNTAKALDDPGNPPNTALIVGVICGCVGGIVIIVILVYVFKKKGHKTKPGKKVLTLEQRVVEGNDNTCEQQENTTKLSTAQEQEEKQQQNVKGPRGNTKPAGGDGRKKRDADSNAEDTEELEERQQRNVENLQYADLDLRPRGNTKPAGGDGRNKLVFNDDSHVEYAEVRKV